MDPLTIGLAAATLVVGAVVGRRMAPTKQFGLTALRTAAPDLQKLGPQGAAFLGLVLNVTGTKNVAGEEARVVLEDNAQSRNEANDNIVGHFKAIDELQLQIKAEDAVVARANASDAEVNSLVGLLA